jgi:hypothetical protein
MKPRRALWLVAVLCLMAAIQSQCGCAGDRQHRQDAAQIAANGYAAAEAAMSGADAQKTMTAVRLAFEKIAEMHGFTIAGAQEWAKSIQKAAPSER